MIQSHGQAEYFPCLHGDARHTIFVFCILFAPLSKHQKQSTKDPILWSPQQKCFFPPHFFFKTSSTLSICAGVRPKKVTPELSFVGIARVRS